MWTMVPVCNPQNRSGVSPNSTQWTFNCSHELLREKKKRQIKNMSPYCSWGVVQVSGRQDRSNSTWISNINTMFLAQNVQCCLLSRNRVHMSTHRIGEHSSSVLKSSDIFLFLMNCSIWNDFTQAALRLPGSILNTGSRVVCCAPVESTLDTLAKKHGVNVAGLSQIGLPHLPDLKSCPLTFDTSTRL